MTYYIKYIHDLLAEMWQQVRFHLQAKCLGAAHGGQPECSLVVELLASARAIHADGVCATGGQYWVSGSSVMHPGGTH